ncbi:hypothetical protein BJ166DRAFT_155242 [Pestalotiopsis sp. NC0098]|nr:hypothetical protein BJ166DRAFT_155242 [Pestalotiopsis sp. NC0098]
MGAGRARQLECDGTSGRDGAVGLARGVDGGAQVRGEGADRDNRGLGGTTGWTGRVSLGLAANRAGLEGTTGRVGLRLTTGGNGGRHGGATCRGSRVCLGTAAGSGSDTSLGSRHGTDGRVGCNFRGDLANSGRAVGHSSRARGHGVHIGAVHSASGVLDITGGGHLSGLGRQSSCRRDTSSLSGSSRRGDTSLGSRHGADGRVNCHGLGSNGAEPGRAVGDSRGTRSDGVDVGAVDGAGGVLNLAGNTGGLNLAGSTSGNRGLGLAG